MRNFVAQASALVTFHERLMTVVVKPMFTHGVLWNLHLARMFQLGVELQLGKLGFLPRCHLVCHPNFLCSTCHLPLASHHAANKCEDHSTENTYPEQTLLHFST